MACDELVRRERTARDREAAIYDRHVAGDWRLQVADAVLIDALELDPGIELLDAGCGTGRHLPYFLERARTVTGVDHSSASLDLAREKVAGEDQARLRLETADVRDLPFADGAFDRVLCAGVIQHLPTAQDRLTAMRELHRVLRPGGRAVVQVYHWGGHIKRHRDGFWGDDIFRHAFTIGELRRLLYGAGFDGPEIRGAAILPAIFEPRRHDIDVQVRWSKTPLRRLADYLVGVGEVR